MTAQISLTVNGEAQSLAVPARTQLAEVLRDHLALTGTHLGCEQGVCGACTVMMNGRPVRSCITFAAACDGAVIETIEGHRDDPVMERLRAAFSRHHALQCGFCTPGMLATARDIVARLEAPDEAAIRHELSGNLCRCTGYVGIVAAIADVIGQERGAAATAASTPVAPASPATFTPFEPEEPAAAPAAPAPQAAPQAARGRERIEAGSTVVERAFALAHPPGEVWALFSDLRRVAQCIPGAVIETLEGAAFEGAVAISFGPIQARFAGGGTFITDPAAQSGMIEGKASDKAGKTSLRGALGYQISPGEGAGQTAVSVSLRYDLQGALAQFNRPELLAALVDHVLGAFIANCDALLSGRAVQKPGGASALRAIWVVLRAFFRGR